MKQSQNMILVPLMNLSVAVLDAIKNRAYNLRPVVKKDSDKKAKCADDGMAEILARRMAMGYKEDSIMEESIISME